MLLFKSFLPIDLFATCLVCLCVDASKGYAYSSLSVNENDIHKESDDFLYLPYKSFHNNPQYLVIAPSEVRPGQIYRIVVTLLSSLSPINFVASLQRNGEEIASASETVTEGDTKTLLMKVPITSRSGVYHLQVEGNMNGVLGGTGFINKALVNFSQRFLSILIQTNQLVYNIRQSIHVRVILLDMQMKPYIDPVDVFLIDSRGLTMKRWLSIYPFQGFVSLVFRLPGDYSLGWWKVRVVAQSQTEEKSILLERWFTDRFDVNVSLPAFASIDDEYLEGHVTANHTNFLPVNGNATIKVFVTSTQSSKYGARQQLLSKTNVIKLFKGSFKFKLRLSEILGYTAGAPRAGSEIEVQVKVGERFYEHFVTGYARTRIVNSTIILQFLDSSPMIFKPGMPFETHLAVSYEGQVPLPPDKLALSVIKVTPSSNQIKLDEDSLRVSFDSNGVAKVKLIVPRGLTKFSLNAHFTDGTRAARAQLHASAAYSPSQRFIQVTSSTEVGQVGEYAIFHVRANFYVKFFFYIVISKGIVITSGREKGLGMLYSITTFSVALSPEMAPSSKVTVYHVSADGEVLADTVTLPVKGISRESLNLRINKKQDRSGNLIELVPQLAVGSIIGLSCFQQDFYDIQGLNDITPATALIELYKNTKGKHKKVIWRNMMGRSERVTYYATPNVAQDTEATFAFSDLIIFTNMNVTTSINICNDNLSPNSSVVPNLPGFQTTMSKEMMLPCVTGNHCYPISRHCDGRRDCSDGSDEKDCYEAGGLSDDLMQFLLFRRNRNNYFYQATGEDFGWEDTFTGYSTDNYVPVQVPKRPVQWTVNAIGVSQGKGFSILESPLTYSSARLFFITVEAPDTIGLGEQVGIKVAAFNYQPFEIRADILLESSLDYRFVQVDPLGLVSHYSPRTTKGTHQHLVYIKAFSSRLVHIPVVATTKGKIKVKITGRSQVATETVVLDMEVLADGTSVSLHTSMLLDMTSQAYLVKFLNINVTEDPIIPFQENTRRFVFGSPEASVTVIGDVVGAPAFETSCRSIADFTSLAIARPAKSGDLLMFNFAYHFYTLMYLKLTDQLGHQSSQQLKQWMDVLNQDYVTQTTYFRNGSFVMFKRGKGSVWLSAYCARIYHEALYPEWEHLLYIDPIIIKKSVHFILHHQHTDGHFMEPYTNVTSYRLTPVALTAHVLVTLCRVSTVMGSMGAEVNNAKKLAVRFLEQRLSQLDRTFEVAIATYALMEARSVEAKVGFDLLEKLKKTTEGMTYWSQMTVEPVQIIYQSQRPYIQHRLPQRSDSEAVEATSYVLMVYNRFGGLMQESIVKWLNFMRLHYEGFISIYDTIVALEALVDFSFRTHVRSVTNMKLIIEPSSQPDLLATVEVNSDNLAQRHNFPIVPNVWGHITVTAKGAGYALLQLHTKYNVDKEEQLLKPPIKAFDLKVQLHSSGRNKSVVHFRSCGRWSLSREQLTSGVAIMEIDIPTGYLQYKPVVDQYLDQGVVPRLRRARILPKSAVFMFDYLTSDWTCVEFSVERWFPVANMTRYFKSRLYDLNQPEYFVETISDGYALFTLSICEVCGSYQCPYCPYFSSALISSLSLILLLFSLIVLTFYRHTLL